MKVRYDESFLFPQSQVDFNRGAISFPQGLLHGFGGLGIVQQSDISAAEAELNMASQSLTEVMASFRASPIDPEIDPGGFADRAQQIQNVRARVEQANQNLQSLRAQYAQESSQRAQQAAAEEAAAQLRAANAAQLTAAQQAAAQQAAATKFVTQVQAAEASIEDRLLDLVGNGQIIDLALDLGNALYKASVATGNAQLKTESGACGEIYTNLTAARQRLNEGNKEAALAMIKLSMDQVKSGTCPKLLSVFQTGVITQADVAAATYSAPAPAQASAPASAQTSATMATNTSTVGYDLAVSLLKAAGKYTAGMTEQQMATALTALEGNPVFVMTPAATATAIAATKTQTTATNTATGTVQTTDKVSGTTSTVNAATGAVTVTTSTGQTASGTGTVAAGGVITTVDPKAGVVTTQNTQTGVVTQTDAATGKTVTATQITGTSGGGGTFMFPDQKTVSTATAITSTGGLDSGKIALFGLIGLLLLRGAVR